MDIYKLDPLSVVYLVLQELQALLHIRPAGNETFNDFETVFCAHIEETTLLPLTHYLSCMSVDALSICMVQTPFRISTWRKALLVPYQLQSHSRRIN